MSELFTSVPVDPALDIIENRLQKDHTLLQRKELTTQHIIEPLGFCLHSIYFMFQDKYCEKVEGTAMGSPVSSIVVFIYMQFFQNKVPRTSKRPPSLWKRFVYDTFLIQCTEHKNFLHYINNIDRAIKFAVEDTSPDGLMPFLDTLIKHNGTLSTRVYIRSKHTDQYLQWDSHHCIRTKYSIINTLTLGPKQYLLPQNILEQR